MRGPAPVASYRPTTAAQGEEPATPVARKFRNVPTTDEESGEHFDSRLECRVWRELVARYGRRNVLRQVSFCLPGRIRMRPDFVVLERSTTDGRAVIARVIDAKGAPPTNDWRNKAKLMAATFDLHVEIVRDPKEI